MSYIITHKEVITRKEHKCFGCARTFPRNTKMLREAVKDDIIFTAYLCPTCQKIAYDGRGDEFCEGDLYELAVEAEQAEKDGAELDNPCKYCPKANLDFVNDNEYGCNTPCKDAKNFWNVVSKQLDDLLERARDLLKGGAK